MPCIEPLSDWVVGMYPTSHTLQQLDGLAESAGWMPEPRHMHVVRSSVWYDKPILEFIVNTTPARPFEFTPKAALLSSFIFWRILDWGCGMDDAVQAWLRPYGHSVTYALRSQSRSRLEEIYQGHLRGDESRSVSPASPSITGCVDSAEWLFGFHPITDIVSLVPFLISKVRQDMTRMHDSIYFLSRCIAFLLRARDPGYELIRKNIAQIRELAVFLDTVPDEALLRTSGCGEMSILDEAKLGVQAILEAIDTQDETKVTYLKHIWSLADLDDIYESLWKLPLRDHTVNKLTAAGDQNHALLLSQQICRSRCERFGVNHPQSVYARESLVYLQRKIGNIADAVLEQERILHYYEQANGAGDEEAIEAAVRLGELLLRAGNRTRASGVLQSALENAPSTFEQDHYLVKFCHKTLSEIRREAR